LFAREDVQERGGEGRRAGKAPDPNRMISKNVKDEQPYRCGDHDVLSAIGREKFDAVEALLSARVSARMRRNYEAADRIREELREEHGVLVDDRSQLWHLRGDEPEKEARGEPKGWKMARGMEGEGDAFAEGLGLVDVPALEALLEQRDAARRGRSWGEADA
ncbi:hypothetical protein TeGR_g13505, partial [Tetraparma gracilis]